MTQPEKPSILKWHVHLRKFAFDRLGRGQKNYVKYIILARSRTGSNLLRGLLNAHSQIDAYGEVFRDADSIDWDHIGRCQSAKALKLWQHAPIEFLETQLFGKYPKKIAAVGFKLFYYHGQEENWSSVWPYLEDQSNLKVIHIKRRNILETHLSRKRAEMTAEWVNVTGAQEKQKPHSFLLDYDECLADFERTRAWETDYDARFAHHPLLEVGYEDLAKDHETEMARAFDFLGVHQEAVHPTTYKQAQRTLSQRIINYDELKKQFLGSPWETFFEEP